MASYQYESVQSKPTPSQSERSANGPGPVQRRNVLVIAVVNGGTAGLDEGVDDRDVTSLSGRMD